MSRHAGFAAAATIRQKTLNEVIVSYCYGMVPPLFLPLPTTVSVGNVQVSLSGIMRMLPPTLELHKNAGNHVQVHFAFHSTLRAQAGNQPTQTWTVQWKETVTAGIVVSIQDHQVVLGIDTTQVTFQPLSVNVLRGPAIPQPILHALESKELASAVTHFVRGLPPLTISPPLLQTRIRQTIPLNLPWIIDPDWIKIHLDVSNIGFRILERAISVGVDFEGFTSGDAGKLVDLTRVRGSGRVYIEKVTQETDSDLGPLFTSISEPTGPSIATAVNMDFVSAVVHHQISPQIFAVQTPDGNGTPIVANPYVRLLTIRAEYSKFHKPLRGTEDGLAVHFQVAVDAGPWFDASGLIMLQIYLRQAFGTTEFEVSHPDEWRLYVAMVKLDLPWWVDFAEVVLTGLSIYFGAAIPVLAPLLGVACITLLGGVVPDIIANVENLARQGAQKSIDDPKNGVSLPGPWNRALPGLNYPRWGGAINYLSIAKSSLDMGINTMPEVDIPTIPLGTISPDSWDAMDKRPIKLSLKLRHDLERLGGANLMVSWKVRRSDTKHVVAQGDKAYNDPHGNGIQVPHHTHELYHVDAYDVSCSATLTLGSQVGQIWSGRQTISIQDNLDRHSKYVEWGPHTVHFKNAGTGEEWWSHIRRSRIHRTAVSARCLMLRQPTQLVSLPFDLSYTSSLPFPWHELNAHRKPLCEYCFFGGPDKTVPLPEQDWF